MSDRRILIGVTVLFVLAVIPVLFVRPPRPVVSAEPELVRLAALIDQEHDHLTLDEVDSLLAADSPLTIYDLRDSIAYESGHLPSAVRTTVADLLLLTPDSASHILLYSEGGVHAGQAWVLMKAAGHPHVHTLLGSWSAWSAAHPRRLPRRTPSPPKPQNNSRERERSNGEC